MLKEEQKLDVFVKNPENESISKDYLEQYITFLNEQEIIENNLIGTIKNGEYTLSLEIKKELVEAKKLMTERFENHLLAVLLIEEISLNLELKFSEFEEDKMIAQLFLIEEKKGEEIKTFVADYVEEKSDDFKFKARVAFNIEIETGVDVLEYAPYIKQKLSDNEYKKLFIEDLPTLRKRLRINKLKRSADREFVIEMYSELYVLRMLKILAKLGPLGDEIIADYEKFIKENKLEDKSTPNLYTKLRKQLDKAILIHGGLTAISTEMIKNGGENADRPLLQALKEFVEPVKEFDDLLKKPAPILIKKETLKKSEPEKKATPASKAGGEKKKSGGSKSKGGGSKAKSGGAKKKSDSKKKDDKKKPVLPNVKLDENKTTRKTTTKKEKPAEDVAIDDNFDEYIKKMTVKTKTINEVEENSPIKGINDINQDEEIQKNLHDGSLEINLTEKIHEEKSAENNVASELYEKDQIPPVSKRPTAPELFL